MSGDSFQLANRQLLTMDLLMVQQAPPSIAPLILPPGRRDEAVFLLAVHGQRLHTASRDTIGLLGSAEQLGYVAGLGAARIRQAGKLRLAAQFEAGQAKGVAAAQAVTEPARRTNDPISQAEYTTFVAADVADQRSEVADMVAELRKALAGGDGDDALRDWYERMFRQGQADLGALATLAVAALAELADG